MAERPLYCLACLAALVQGPLLNLVPLQYYVMSGDG